MGKKQIRSRCNHCGKPTSRTICEACICKGCNRLFVLCDCEQKQFQKKCKTFSDIPRAYAAHTSRISGEQSQKRDTTQTLDDRKTSANLPHRDAETKHQASCLRQVSERTLSPDNLHAPDRPGVTANGPVGFFYGVAP